MFASHAIILQNCQGADRFHGANLPKLAQEDRFITLYCVHAFLKVQELARDADKFHRTDCGRTWDD
ncbi:MAG: hypothetical protein DMG78_10455 [Acidobacteria bacterium]|nr:MAG: hypothetical protein DMG78_10455 [Acidobacteriota bacterium]